MAIYVFKRNEWGGDIMVVDAYGTRVCDMPMTGQHRRYTLDMLGTLLKREEVFSLCGGHIVCAIELSTEKVGQLAPKGYYVTQQHQKGKLRTFWDYLKRIVN